MKGLELGDVIANEFRESSLMGSLYEAFTLLVNTVENYNELDPLMSLQDQQAYRQDLMKLSMKHAIRGIKEGMSCCGKPPEVNFHSDHEYSLSIYCGGCGAKTVIKGGEHNVQDYA